MSLPNTNSLAFTSSQFMTDYRKVEELLCKIQREKRNAPTEDEKVFLRGVLKRLPANKRNALQPVFDKLFAMSEKGA